MTNDLRDMFAAQCLAGMVANPYFAQAAFEERTHPADNQARYAKACYQFADAMLTERGEENEDVS